ncbi:hypothetical protein BH23PLA1_BH23PLA1_24770 [soil metagenome]
MSHDSNDSLETSSVLGKAPDLPPPPGPMPVGPGLSPLCVPGYTIERKLGQGGMGVVYLARRERDGAAVALKTITPATAGTEGAVARFLLEADVLRQLDHPKIVRFLEMGQADGQLYFVMEYVPGLDAWGLLKRQGGPLTISQAVGLACQALKGLAYAHELGFVHRNIKPHNLLISKVGGRLAVKVVDFGLARIYQDSPLSGLTLTNQVLGTPAFMPPEQITHFRESKPPVDQYALGATLYTLLTGEKIHDFPPRPELQLLMILQEDPVPIRSRRADIPEELAALIHRSLARDPAKRFPDVEAMRAALLTFGRPHE